MLIVDGKEFRNLEEQVKKNKEDIAMWNAGERTLSNFGIKVVGKVDSPNDLPNPISYAGTFGDAYVVGWEAPYTYYIYTRADTNAGQLTNYWLDIGLLSIEGPQGPQGEQGPQGLQGARGNKWTSGENAPSAGSYNVGDMYLQVPAGNIYEYTPNGWVNRGSIRGSTGPRGDTGPQGERGIQGLTGPQGPQGPAGQSFRVVSTLNSVSQLPSPSTAAPGTAYIVGSTGSYLMYILIGEGSGAAWVNAGSINGIEGPQGPAGIAGVGVQTIENISQTTNNGFTSSTIRVSYTNGTSQTFQINAKNANEWDAGTSDPPPSVGRVDDLYINTTTGTIFYKGSQGWINMGNIRGPQGPQGPQGIPGEPAKTKEFTPYNMAIYCKKITNQGIPFDVWTDFGTANSLKLSEGSGWYAVQGLPGSGCILKVESGWDNSDKRTLYYTDTNGIQYYLSTGAPSASGIPIYCWKYE